MYIYIYSFYQEKDQQCCEYFQKVSMFHSVYGLRQIFPPSARVYFNLQLFILKLNFPGLNQDSGVFSWALVVPDPRMNSQSWYQEHSIYGSSKLFDFLIYLTTSSL